MATLQVEIVLQKVSPYIIGLFNIGAKEHLQAADLSCDGLTVKTCWFNKDRLKDWRSVQSSDRGLQPVAQAENRF